MGDALEELRAMNAAPSGGRGPVRNQDKRTSRLDNKDRFQRAILQHRAELPAHDWLGGLEAKPDSCIQSGHTQQHCRRSYTIYSVARDCIMRTQSRPPADTARWPRAA